MRPSLKLGATVGKEISPFDVIDWCSIPAFDHAAVSCGGVSIIRSASSVAASTQAYPRRPYWPSREKRQDRHP